MIPLRLRDVSEAVAARVASVEDDAVVVTGVQTDSRQVGPGDLYVARVGARHDGADFASQAVAAGAVGVVARHPIPRIPTLVVSDPDAALAALARTVRERSDAMVVAITGSVGKTTTKDFVAAACRGNLDVVAAHGSFNNEVGVPLTVTRLTADTRVLVTELGARGPGQVAALAGWLAPDVAVVTAVAEVHLSEFGDIEAIAATKGELVEALAPTGLAVLNEDDIRVRAMANRTRASVLGWSAMGRPSSQVRARNVALDAVGRARFTAETPWGTTSIHLPIIGRHHVGNALAALAVAAHAGVPVDRAAAGLASAQVSTGRARLVNLDDATVVDDSYNANPTSVAAALDTLATMEVRGRRVAVLGVMAEIGPRHAAEHRRIGRLAASVVDHLVVVGDQAAGLAAGAGDAGLGSVVQVDDAASAAAAVGLGPGDVVLVKASRVAGLEDVVRLLQEAGQ